MVLVLFVGVSIARPCTENDYVAEYSMLLNVIIFSLLYSSRVCSFSLRA